MLPTRRNAGGVIGQYSGLLLVYGSVDYRLLRTGNDGTNTLISKDLAQLDGTKRISPLLTLMSACFPRITWREIELDFFPALGNLANQYHFALG